MTDAPEYTPPEVWVWEKGDSPNWRYSNTNRPIAGATHEKELPRGKHPLQLYSLATPNGVKRSEEHTSELQSPMYLVCRLLLEKKKKKHNSLKTQNNTKSTRYQKRNVH